jgi:hypothetical protein
MTLPDTTDGGRDQRAPTPQTEDATGRLNGVMTTTRGELQCKVRRDVDGVKEDDDERRRRRRQGHNDAIEFPTVAQHGGTNLFSLQECQPLTWSSVLTGMKTVMGHKGRIEKEL